MRLKIAAMIEATEIGSQEFQPGSAAWIPVARKILAKEFDKAMDRSVRASMEIGLRSNQHPDCIAAMEYLKGAA